ncbi:hypothetical protein CG51_15495 [Haematobacter missouriensis]|nr:hypothetical protein CG51_15495 [Haematobacter missouriensis]
MQTAEGKLYLFVAIDRRSKFAVTQLVYKADRKTAWEVLSAHARSRCPTRFTPLSPIEPLDCRWSERQWRGASNFPSSLGVGTPSPPGPRASTCVARPMALNTG